MLRTEELDWFRTTEQTDGFVKVITEGETGRLILGFLIRFSRGCLFRRGLGDLGVGADGGALEQDAHHQVDDADRGEEVQRLSGPGHLRQDEVLHDDEADEDGGDALQRPGQSRGGHRPTVPHAAVLCGFRRRAMARGPVRRTTKVRLDPGRARAEPERRRPTWAPRRKGSEDRCVPE